MSSSLFKFDLKIKYRSVPTCRDYGWGRFFMEAYGLAVSLAEGVGVDAHALSRREVVDPPPAHLQEDERDEEPPECCTAVAVRTDAHVDISQIGEPCSSSPSLLGVPRPVVPPGFLRPERPEENADRHERPADLHEVVADVHLVIVDG